MIIRRRTYIKLFTGLYGYFMRNVDAFNGCRNGSDDEKTNIYTKCMLREAPIGAFPLQTRLDDAINVTSSLTSKPCVGYTDGTTIIVATGKNLYRSTNGGVSFTKLCTWFPSNRYINRRFGPYVYMDSTKYYIFYSLEPNSFPGYVTTHIFTYTISNGQYGSSSALDSVYASETGGGYGTYVLRGDYGTFFGMKVSKAGLIMYLYSTSNNNLNWNYKIADLPAGRVSNVFTLTARADAHSNYLGHGCWYNDNSTKGKFFVSQTNLYYYDEFGGGMYDYHTEYRYYRIDPTINSSGNVSYTELSTSTFGSMFTDNCLPPDGYNLMPNYPMMIVASADTYYNKLFVAMTIKGTYSELRFYICNANFSSPQVMSFDRQRDYIDGVLAGGAYGGIFNGNCVSPDGLYGVMLYSTGAMVFNLQTKSCESAFGWISNDNDGISQYGDSTGYMLPKRTI